MFINFKNPLRVAISIVLSIVFIIPLSAQKQSNRRDAQNKFVLKENTYQKLNAVNITQDVSFVTETTTNGSFTVIELPGFTKIYDIGKPQLPVMSKLIEMPYNANAQIKVIKSEFKEINLSKAGYSAKILPCQPSYFKNTDPSDVIFQYDEQFYTTDAFSTPDLVHIEHSGILRGVNIGQLIVSPFSYNPAKNILRIYYNIEFEVVFKNADIAKTIEQKNKYYSPAFQPVFSTMANYKPSTIKESITTYPVTYVIVSPNTFQAALKPFIEWKTRKGFNVIEAYTSDPNVGNTTTSIKAYLQGLYNAGTPANPAPSYVLFVGDVAQIPSFSGTTGTHVSDMYYCEYDGGSDYIPDVYYGRFSATNLTQLQPQIDKTLLYEQYQMDITSYLDTVVLVAGVDASWAPTHGNGQINYGVNNYFNASNSIYSHTYLYPASQSQAAQIRADVGKGVGFANYTAHCNSNGWGDPSFTTSHIPAMSNVNKYGLMIGNCCLSNKFDDNECFGEGLLRAANKGAVGYIGGSNNTLWDEDFYWSVGFTSNVTANPTYAGTGLGSYDRVFHTHNEPESDWYISNAQMIYAGNLGVQASSSSSKKYYWEIYHIMGDPSLMTYLYEPTILQVTYTDPIVVGESTLTVTTEPGAYVALSKNNVLLSAVLADANGIAQLSFQPFMSPDTADIVVTKQNKIPYVGTVKIINVTLALDAALVTVIEPLSQYNCAGLPVIPKVFIRNMGLSNLQSLTINYRINNGAIIQQQWNGTLPSLSGDTVLLPSFILPVGQFNFKAFTSNPNNATDMNHVNDTVSKNIATAILPVSANFTVSDTSFCNVPATIYFTNQSINGLNYLWDFGDGNTSNLASPSYTYQNIGQYTVSLTADAGVCGSNTYTSPYTLNIGLLPPAVTHAQNCGPASLQLSASGYSEINWFYNQGDLTPILSGDTFTTPFLNNTTTYYVQGVVSNPVLNVGKTDNSGSGGYFSNASNMHYLIFNCNAPSKLISVKVYANGAGNRTVLLRDSLSNIIDSVTVNMPNGESRVTLNFDLPVANNMQLVGAGAVNLYRNNNNSAVYPYEQAGFISITESSASLPQYNSPGNYYYFYDWEVKENDCLSLYEPVTAYILDVPVSAFTFNQNAYTVAFNNQSQYAMNILWDFGDGSTSTLANPIYTYAGPGTYNVKLFVDNICGADSTENQVVLQGMAPVTDFSATPLYIYEGDYVAFTDHSTFTPTSWNWIFEGGFPASSSQQNPVVQYNTMGSYYVTLISSNTYGNGYLHKPFYINVSPLSVDEHNSTNTIKVYPNPVTDKEMFLTTDFEFNSKTNIQIYNVLGAQIPFNIIKLSSNAVNIKLGNISSGLYFVRVSGNNNSEVLKISVY